MSNFNRRLVKIMSEMRSKNLFVILCIPNFFELDRYPAIHRSTGLIRVYKRGVWELYNYRNKKMLYLKGKKSYSYGSVPANIRGRFPKCFILPKEAYEKKKQKAINDWLHSGDKQNKIKEQRNKMISFLLENNKANAKEISEIVGLSPDYIRKMRNVVPKVEEVVPKPQIVVPKEQIGQNVAPKGLIRQIPVSVPHSITLKKEMVSV